MLLNEACWLRTQLARIQPEQLFPMLNVGSHSEQYRRRGQPWIDRHVFAPLPRAGREVVHTDIRPAQGVDVVGDLLDPRFREDLRQRRFRSAICTNLLEHVSDRQPIAAAVAEAVEPGGLVIVTCPHRFPYHPDPIDTMYRPDVDALARLFPGTAVEKGEIVGCGTLASYLAARLWFDPLSFVRQPVHDTGEKSERETAEPGSRLGILLWLVKQFQTTCVILRKEHRS